MKLLTHALYTNLCYTYDPTYTPHASMCMYACMDACTCLHENVCVPVFLISSYGAPLAQKASYLALHSSLFGPVAQLIMIILSLIALTLSSLAQDVFPMVHTLTIFEPIWPKLQNLSKNLICAYVNSYEIILVSSLSYHRDKPLK